jgi:DNA repair exonuclease SbcCD ATPase subunit
MILRSIRTEGLGCFAESFTAGPFEPGINVVYAPNATGKSTLFRALSLAFLEPHRGKSAEMQALRPWGRRLSPQVGVEFEHSGRIYRIRKRFLDAAASHVDTSEGDRWTPFAEGDHADDFLRELLQSESDKPRSAKREHWGLAQVLWTTQGDLSLPTLSSSVIESIRGSVGAQLTARDSAIDARVNEEYLKYYSPTLGKLKSGRNAAPLNRLETERDRLGGELQTAEGLLQQFEAESNRIEQLRATEEIAADRRNELAKQIEDLRSAAGQYNKLSSERKERIAQRDAAQARHKSVSEKIQTISRMRSQIAVGEKSLAELVTKIPALTVQAGAKEKTASEADAARARTTTDEETARASLQTAQLADLYVRALAEREKISHLMSEVAASQQEMQLAIAEKTALNAPTETQLRDLRAALTQETDAHRKLDLARITVGFVPETRIEVHVVTGEQPGAIVCEPGEPVVLPGAPNLAFSIAGVGRFDARGPVGDYEAVRCVLDERRKWIAAFANQFGTADPEVLEGRRHQAADFDSSIRSARNLIRRLLDGNSETAIHERHAEISKQILVVENAHAEWVSQPPAAADLMAAANTALTNSAAARNAAEDASRQAHTQLAEAQSQLHIAINRQTSLQQQSDQARRILDDCLTDNVSDADRQQAVENAALEYDACRVKLEGIDTELKRFAEDPAITITRISAEMGKAEHQADKAKEERLRAETRIQGLVERRPYAVASELSESLAVVREQIDREDRRMKALALLRKTLDEARAEMMVAVSAPVERIATDYLEEICGKPIAEIRLSQSLATDHVVPTALADGAQPGVELDRLSGGEREQIFLCTRIALGSELARRERQMVVLDDVLTYTDDERMDRICHMLARASDRLQLIILTCHPERFASLKGTNRIDLLAAIGRKEVGAHV